MYERDRRDALPAHALEHRERHAAHRPPAHDVGGELAEVALEHAGVVALQREPLAPGQPRELVVAPVPAELAPDVRVVGLRRSDVEIGCQHERLVVVALEVSHRGSPDELVSAEVVRRVHVADRQDPHGGEHRLRAWPIQL